MKPPISEASDSASEEVDLGRLVAIVWAGRLWLALFVGISGVLGLAKVLVTPPTYQADALLQLEERGTTSALPTAMQDLVGTDTRTVTELEILRSRMILGQVVADLNLDWRAAPVMFPVVGYALTRFDLPIPELAMLSRYARRGDAISLDLLEVPPAWVGMVMHIDLTGEGTFRVVTPDGGTHDGMVGRPLRLEAAGFALQVGTLTGPVGRAFTISQISEASAITAVRDALSASERGTESGVLDLRFDSPEALEAQRVLDSILRVYTEQNVVRSAAEAQSSLEFIEGQMPEAESKVNAAESALNAFRQEQQSVDLTFETQSLLTQVSQIEGELRVLSVQEDEISKRYTPNHPVYQQLLNQQAQLEEQQAVLEREISNLPETQREVLNMTRNLEIDQAMYSELLTRAQALRVVRASTIGNVRIIDSAQTAAGPIAPRGSRILALFLLLGTFTGIAVVLFRNYLHKGIQGAEELEQIGLPVFATINLAPSDAAPGRHLKLHRPILALIHPTELAVEAFRSLRTSLHFGMLDAATRSIAVISTAPGAGKSFVSTNLAVVAAQSGQAVCLVDADLRRGELRKFFGVEKGTPGLAELLAGTASLDDVLVAGPVAGLFFIPSGQLPPNPAELLMRQSLRALIDDLNARFHLSIFDCPPVLAVTDPVIIGRATGSTIAVIRHDVTPIDEVRAMQRTLQTSGLQLSGAILNAFDPRRGKAGSSYSYNYRYDYKARKD